MEKSVYTSFNKNHSIDFIAPIKILIKKKTLEKAKTRTLDKSSTNKGCLKFDSDTYTLYDYEKAKAVKKVTFPDKGTQLEEVIRVVSYKDYNLKNTFVGIKNKFGIDHNNENVACSCLLF